MQSLGFELSRDIGEDLPRHYDVAVLDQAGADPARPEALRKENFL